MKKITDFIINKYNLDHRNIFLTDGLGAFFSTILLFGLLANYEDVFGVPKTTIYWLASPAFAFMLYSLSCYFLNIHKWKSYLILIAVANCLYCIFSLGALVWHHNSLTIIGLMYFVGEIAIVYLLINIEWRIIKNSKT